MDSIICTSLSSCSSLIISFVYSQICTQEVSKVLRRVIRDYWNCNYCGTTGIAGNVYTCPSCKKARGKDAVLHIAPRDDIVPVPDTIPVIDIDTIIPDTDTAIPNTVADFVGDHGIDDNYWSSFPDAISNLPWRGIGIITAIILAIAYAIGH